MNQDFIGFLCIDFVYNHLNSLPRHILLRKEFVRVHDTWSLWFAFPCRQEKYSVLSCYHFMK